mmetsp:Transcript_93182/g.266327  ORF Transcript_93182/g.266327 Transcript_93182/m.266327 type:complete len:236 (-) Transcript_93182:1432-2139(-)
MKAVNASFFPGEAVALMGPSGAGKTTLLNILACRAAGKVSGRVTINDAPASPKVFKQIANFIPQDDILIESLTPRQALEYIALLRLSGDVPKEAVKMHLDQLVQSLGLKRCEHSPVGDPLSKGLSGGQRKRVSIAMVSRTRRTLCQARTVYVQASAPAADFGPLAAWHRSTSFRRPRTVGAGEPTVSTVPGRTDLGPRLADGLLGDRVHQRAHGQQWTHHDLHDPPTSGGRLPFV